MYGKITVGVGTSQQTDLEMVDFVQAKFKDNRIITVSEIEDGSLIGVVENVRSSGRASEASIWLSKESFIGLISTAMLYFNIKGEDMQELLKQSLDEEDVKYTFSDNLNDNVFKTEEK